MSYGFLIDCNNCIGCHTCAVACKDANNYKLGIGFREVRTFCTGEYPEVAAYNVSYLPHEKKLSPKTGGMCVCDGCADIRAAGEQPACVAACPMRAIEWGSLDELTVKHRDKNLSRSFPALDEMGEAQQNSIFILKDCMLEKDYDRVVL